MIAAFARTLNWSEYKAWLCAKYSRNYASNIYRYSKKYSHMQTGSLKDIELLSPYVQDHVVKALTTLSKYLGNYQAFKKKLQDHGIKTFRPDAFASFLRILNNNNNGDLHDWYQKATSMLKPNERLFLQFAALTGIRKDEALQSFNLIIKLHGKGELNSYYNEELQALEHFKFKQLFLRRTKNCYISFVPKPTIQEIAESQQVTYWALLNRLKRKGLRTRINELRDHFGTLMVRHGLIREEVDLLQGRIPANVFIRHYWTPSFRELGDRTLEAMKPLQEELFHICQVL